MNPQLVDVNVHPAKREVRFNKPYIVSGAVAEALKTALRAATGPSVSVSPSITVKAMLQGAGISYIPKEKHPEFELSIGNEQAENLTGGERPGIPVKTDNLSAPVIPPNINDTEEHKELFTGNRARTELPGTGPLKVIGFVENTYIIAVAASSLVLIDQHAAHERVLFEKLQNKRDGEIPSQKLLIPVTVELSRHEAVFMDANKEEFCKVGFQLESFGENTIIVHSVPAVLKQDNISGLIKDLVGEFSENGVVRKEANPSLIAGAACKAAVKANDVLRVNEAEALIKQMSECEFPFSCPHGRPTVINITTKELEKRFGRR
jgi:DNA mismatch repair protein MutL